MAVSPDPSETLAETETHRGLIGTSFDVRELNSMQPICRIVQFDSENVHIVYVHIFEKSEAGIRTDWAARALRGISAEEIRE